MTTPTHYTILLVDDNRQLLSLLTEGLPMAGPFHVITAENGVQALEIYGQVQPDCIVIDVKMPELDGNQLVRALRGDPSTANTPLVMLTALAQEQDRLRGVFSGADLYLLKPVKPRELAQAILTVMAQTQGERTRRYQKLAEESLDFP